MVRKPLRLCKCRVWEHGHWTAETQDAHIGHCKLAVTARKILAMGDMTESQSYSGEVTDQ